MPPHSGAFRQIEFGPDDAKGDERLSRYFVEVPAYQRVRDGHAMFVVGRKGTGKTAICEMLFQQTRHTPTKFASILSFKNNPSAALFMGSDETFTAPNQYISIWRFLIALEAAKLVLQDESVPAGIQNEFRQFIGENFGRIDVASLDAVTTLRDRKWRVGIHLPLDLPGADVGRDSRDTQSFQVHYGRAAEALLQRLAAIPTNNEFLLLFDELDEDYKIEPKYFDLIISLLKAAYQVRVEMRNRIKLRPIVVLREDIHSQLVDHDLNKHSDMTVYLRWVAEDKGGGGFSLRGLVNQRIAASFGLGEGDHWPHYVNEDPWGVEGLSAWHWHVHRTMLRPRDIVESLKRCQEPQDRGGKLELPATKRSMEGYSRWLYDEVRGEMKLLPDAFAATSILTQLGGQFTLQAWSQSYRQQVLKSSESEAVSVLKSLYEFGVVGMHAPMPQPSFRHTDPQIPFSAATKTFVVHPGLRPHLAIAPGPKEFPHGFATPSKAKDPPETGTSRPDVVSDGHFAKGQRVVHDQFGEGVVILTRRREGLETVSVAFVTDAGQPFLKTIVADKLRSVHEKA